MKLIIDIGNTRVKAALFERNELVESFVFDSMEQLLNENLFEKHKIENCIVASVVNDIDRFVEKLNQKTNVLLFTNETLVPIKNLYKSAHTLGSDRLAGAVGGNFLFPDKDILIIDAGTCIKYNFVNRNNEYIGGGISPGLHMRFKALNTFTSRLPLIKFNVDFNKLVGMDSEESILSGVELGTIAEVDGIIEQYKSVYSYLTVVFTGGDVYYFEKRLKNSIFADPNLILKGLNVILEYNINAKT